MPDIQEFLNQDLPNRVRNNHALEHATLHVLQEKGITGRFGGISDAGGFWIYGEIATETLLLAAQEALKRLADGESALAVHPNCGTNLAVGSLAAGGLAWIGMRGTKGNTGRRLARLPIAVLMGIIGYQMAKPLGPKDSGADHHQRGCQRDGSWRKCCGMMLAAGSPFTVSARA